LSFIVLPPKEKALNKNVQGKPKNTRDPCAKKKAPECKRIPEQPPQAQDRTGSALDIFFHPTVLSASEFHRIMPYGSWAVPPVGNCTLP
jgi:hypothetical protein